MSAEIITATRKAFTVNAKPPSPNARRCSLNLHRDWRVLTEHIQPAILASRNGSNASHRTRDLQLIQAARPVDLNLPVSVPVRFPVRTARMVVRGPVETPDPITTGQLRGLIAFYRGGRWPSGPVHTQFSHAPALRCVGNEKRIPWSGQIWPPSCTDYAQSRDPVSRI